MSLANILTAFLKVRSDEDRNDLGWTHWVLDTKPKGQVYAIDTTDYIDRVYAVRLLRAASAMSDDEIRATALAPDRQLSHMISEEGPFRKMIEGLLAPENRWHSFLPANAAEKLPALKDLFAKTREAAAAQEAAEIREAVVAEAKVTELHEQAIKEFKETSTILALAEKAKLVETLAKSPEGTAPISLGYNTIANKEAFIENWHVHFVDFGEQYGRGIADGLDSRAIEAFTVSVPGWPTQVSEPNALSDQLRSAVAELKKSGASSLCIITALNLDLSFPQVADFFPRWHRDCEDGPENKIPGFTGRFQSEALGSIPVFRVRHATAASKRTFLLLDLRSMGSLLLLTPTDNPAEEVFVKDNLFVKVTDLNRNEAERKRILGQDPKWLAEHKDPEGYLRDRVLVQIHIRFAHKVGAKPLGYRFQVLKTAQLH